MVGSIFTEYQGLKCTVFAFESPQTSQPGLYNEMLSQERKREIKENLGGGKGEKKKEKGKARPKGNKIEWSEPEISPAGSHFEAPSVQCCSEGCGTSGRGAWLAGG